MPSSPLDSKPKPAPRAALLIAMGILSVVMVCGVWTALVFSFLVGAEQAANIRLTANRIRIQELEARRGSEPVAGAA